MAPPPLNSISALNNKIQTKEIVATYCCKEVGETLRRSTVPELQKLSTDIEIEPRFANVQTILKVANGNTATIDSRNKLRLFARQFSTEFK